MSTKEDAYRAADKYCRDEYGDSDIIQDHDDVGAVYRGYLAGWTYRDAEVERLKAALKIGREALEKVANFPNRKTHSEVSRVTAFDALYDMWAALNGEDKG